MAEKYAVQYAEFIENDEQFDHYREHPDYYDVDVSERIVWNHFADELKDEAKALEKAGEALKTYRTVRVKHVISTVTHTF